MWHWAEPQWVCFSIQLLPHISDSVVIITLYVDRYISRNIKWAFAIVVLGLPLNFVEIGPSPDSCIRKLAEFVLVTSMPTKYGGSGGLVWSYPKSMRRKPLMRRSHIPICLSVSVPVQPDTDGPAYAVPKDRKDNTHHVWLVCNKYVLAHAARGCETSPLQDGDFHFPF